MKGKAKNKRKIGKIILMGMGFFLTIVLTFTTTLAWFYDSDWANKYISMAGTVGINIEGVKDPVGNPDTWTKTSGQGQLQFNISTDLAYPGQSITAKARVTNNGGRSGDQGSACYVRAHFGVYTNIDKVVEQHDPTGSEPKAPTTAPAETTTPDASYYTSYGTYINSYHSYITNASFPENVKPTAPAKICATTSTSALYSSYMTQYANYIRDYALYIAKVAIPTRPTAPIEPILPVRSVYSSDTDYNTARSTYNTQYTAYLATYYDYLEIDEDSRQYDANVVNMITAESLYNFLLGVINTQNVKFGVSTNYIWKYYQHIGSMALSESGTVTSDVRYYIDGASSDTEDTAAKDRGYFYLCSDNAGTLLPLQTYDSAVFLWDSAFIIPWQLTNIVSGKYIYVCLTFQAIQTFIPKIGSDGIIDQNADNQLPANKCYANSRSVQTVFNSCDFAPLETKIMINGGEIDFSGSEYTSAAAPTESKPFADTLTGIREDT